MADDKKIYDSDLSKFAYFMTPKKAEWFGSKDQREKRSRVEKIVELLWHSEEFRKMWPDGIPEIKFLKTRRIEIPSKEVFVVIVIGLRLYETLYSSYGWDIRPKKYYSSSLYEESDMRYKYSRSDKQQSRTGLMNNNKQVQPKSKIWHNLSDEDEGTKFASIPENKTMNELRQSLVMVGKDYIAEFYRLSSGQEKLTRQQNFLDVAYKNISNSWTIKNDLPTNLSEFGNFDIKLANEMWNQALYPTVSMLAIDKSVSQIKRKINYEYLKGEYTTFDIFQKMLKK